MLVYSYTTDKQKSWHYSGGGTEGRKKELGEVCVLMICVYLELLSFPLTYVNVWTVEVGIIQKALLYVGENSSQRTEVTFL